MFNLHLSIYFRHHRYIETPVRINFHQFETFAGGESEGGVGVGGVSSRRRFLNSTICLSKKMGDTSMLG